MRTATRSSRYITKMAWRSRGRAAFESTLDPTVLWDHSGAARRGRSGAGDREQPRQPLSAQEWVLAAAGAIVTPRNLPAV